MMNITFFLQVLALVLFVVGAFVNPPKCTLGWLGLAALTLSFLLK